MSRKPKKGYYVQGVFIALGSELDLAYKRELKGTDAASKTDLKRESTERQKLGEDLLELRNDLKQKLLEQGHINTTLMEAVNEAKRITNFEGKRRQMQYVGKLMRRLEESDLQAIRESLEIQHGGSAKETLALHESEAWRKRLIEDDQALGEWLSKYPRQEPQQFRALVRQARKDSQPLSRAEVSTGKAPRQGRAYRELFRWIRETLHPSGTEKDPHSDEAALFETQDSDLMEAEEAQKPLPAQTLFLSVDEIKYKEELAKQELKDLQAEKDRLKEESHNERSLKILTPKKRTSEHQATQSSETAIKEKTTPAKTPVKATTKAPKKTPTKTAAKTAAKTAVKTPAKTPTKTPAKTPAKTAAKKSTIQAPSKTKVTSTPKLTKKS